ncbi:glycoside hydrolase family 2 protein [Salinisphaera sp. RV14]|uniref:glycoside hydrolase family 2 protein n=1 Tax=Salinisphaera sp. RV14 TaxID=3454140 RepID=UPI003F872D97
MFFATQNGGGDVASRRFPHRPRISLDGIWGFEFQPEDDTRQPMPDIEIPGVWQAQHAALRMAFGTGVYRRRVTVPADWAGASIHLCIGASNYRTAVYVDGTPVACHEGGYLPFACDLTAHVTPGEAVLLEIRVTLPSPRPQADGKPGFADIPHGKQSWYGPLGGIWQSLWIEARSVRHIADLRLGSQLGSDGAGVCRARGRLHGDGRPAADERLRLTVRAPDGTTVAECTHAGVADEYDLQTKVALPMLWSPDDPLRYDIGVELVRDGAVVDALHRQTGFRSIVAEGGELLLNGEAFILRGALDQDYYLDTLCTPPSEAFLENQLRQAKAMGFNCLRCHIKVPDPRYLDVADRLGMLLWCEMPNWGQWSTAAAERGLATLEGMIARDDHHPSIIAWTLVNEDWGTDLTLAGDQRAWLKRAFRRIKTLDPSRLVVDNSPCEPNFHLRTDIADYHFYRGIPDRRDQWDAFIAAFAERRYPLFSPHGDAETAGDEPLILSEFGNWGLPRVDALRDAAGREPWWFDTGSDWGDGVMLPRGIEMRFGQYHLDRVFGSLDGFIAATQEQQFQSLKYEIESMRAQPTIAGYVVTELTDVHWEANGLMDMARNPRDFAERFAAVNAPTALLPRLPRHAVKPGERVSLALGIAHDDPAPLDGMRLQWRWDGHTEYGEQLIPRLDRGVQPLPGLPLDIPADRAPGEARLHLALVDRAGHPSALGETSLTVMPETGAGAPTPVVWPARPELSPWLEDAGIPMAQSRDQARVLVATRLDDELVERVRRGAKLLLLVDDTDAIPSPPGVVPVYPEFPRAAVVSRESSVWRGDWASGFSWLRRTGAYADIPGPPMLGQAFAAITPGHVLLGFRTDDFADDVRAGMVMGWIHRGAALIARRALGEGAAVLCTLPVHRAEARGDPMARQLSQALVRDTNETVGRPLD